MTYPRGPDRKASVAPPDAHVVSCHSCFCCSFSRMARPIVIDPVIVPQTLVFGTVPLTSASYRAQASADLGGLTVVVISTPSQKADPTFLEIAGLDFGKAATVGRQVTRALSRRVPPVLSSKAGERGRHRWTDRPGASQLHSWLNAGPRRRTLSPSDPGRRPNGGVMRRRSSLVKS